MAWSGKHAHICLGNLFFNNIAHRHQSILFHTLCHIYNDLPLAHIRCQASAYFTDIGRRRSKHCHIHICKSRFVIGSYYDSFRDLHPGKLPTVLAGLIQADCLFRMCRPQHNLMAIVVKQYCKCCSPASGPHYTDFCQIHHLIFSSLPAYSQCRS